MHPPSRFVRPWIIASLLLMLAGCAASTAIHFYAEPSADFSRYRTYSWATEGPQETGDPRLDNNRFFGERVQTDVDRQLATRGFERTTSGRPQLLVHYHARITQEVERQAADRDVITGQQKDVYCDDCKPFVVDAGTLSIDFVDARTKKLVWRGWAEGSLDGVIDNQDWMERKIDQEVARIMEKFPRRL